MKHNNPIFKASYRQNIPKQISKNNKNEVLTKLYNSIDQIVLENNVKKIEELIKFTINRMTKIDQEPCSMIFFTKNL